MAADKVQFDAFLDDLVPDLNHVPAYRILIGLVGKGNEGKIRVYTWNLAHYTEVDEKNIVYARRLPFIDTGSMLFVKSDEQAQVNAIQQAFLHGQMTQAYQAGINIPTVNCPTTPLTHCPTSGTTVPVVCCPLRGDQANYQTGAVGFPTLSTECIPTLHCPTTPLTNCPTSGTTVPIVCCPLRGDQANYQTGAVGTLPPTIPPICPPPTNPPICPPTIPPVCPPPTVGCVTRALSIPLICC